MPHHGVLQPSNSPPKLRVVFDASARDSKGNSLNDTLHVGPKLQNDIGSILLRFRLHPFALTCDVKQMYRQILITDEHRPYQFIRWTFSPQEPIQTFQLNTVTYGVSSSPFLAIRSLLQLAEEGRNEYPLASKVLNHCLYVDDIVCSMSSIDKAEQLKRELTQLLGKGCFELRKWSSNCTKLTMAFSDRLLFLRREATQFNVYEQAHSFRSGTDLRSAWFFVPCNVLHETCDPTLIQH